MIYTNFSSFNIPRHKKQKLPFLPFYKSHMMYVINQRLQQKCGVQILEKYYCLFDFLDQINQFGVYRLGKYFKGLYVYAPSNGGKSLFLEALCYLYPSKAFRNLKGYKNFTYFFIYSHEFSALNLPAGLTFQTFKEFFEFRELTLFGGWGGAPSKNEVLKLDNPAFFCLTNRRWSQTIMEKGETTSMSEEDINAYANRLYILEADEKLTIPYPYFDPYTRIWEKNDNYFYAIASEIIRYLLLIK